MRGIVMNKELKLLVIQLANEIGIPSKSLLIAVRKSIISGRITQSELMEVIKKLTD